MGRVRAMVVGEDDPAPDTCPGLRSGFPGLQTGAFLRQGPPQAPDEPKVRDANMRPGHRPVPSDGIWVPVRFSRPVQAKDVNRLA